MSSRRNNARLILQLGVSFFYQYLERHDLSPSGSYKWLEGGRLSSKEGGRPCKQAIKQGNYLTDRTWIYFGTNTWVRILGKKININQYRIVELPLIFRFVELKSIFGYKAFPLNEVALCGDSANNMNSAQSYFQVLILRTAAPSTIVPKTSILGWITWGGFWTCCYVRIRYECIFHSKCRLTAYIGSSLIH